MSKENIIKEITILVNKHVFTLHEAFIAEKIEGLETFEDEILEFIVDLIDDEFKEFQFEVKSKLNDIITFTINDSQIIYECLK